MYIILVKYFVILLALEGNEMPTINQLVRKGRKRIVKKTNTPALMSNPQNEVCVFVCTQLPLKSQIQPYEKLHV